MCIYYIHQDGQRTAEQNPHPGVENEATDGRTKTAKRKVATANRNGRRDRKRAREISIGGHHQNQRDLQLIIGEDLSAQGNRRGAVIEGYSDTPAREGSRRGIPWIRKRQTEECYHIWGKETRHTTNK